MIGNNIYWWMLKMGYDAVIKGEVYCGDIDILGNSFYTCYDPIKDKVGKTICIYLIVFNK